MKTTAISMQEFATRMRRFQSNIRKADLDAALVHGSESEFANIRYLSEYWPTFETAGIFVPARGNPVLLVGPESGNYARGRSILPDIAMMIEYRESAEPEYPGIAVDNFKDVAERVMKGRPLKRLGLVGRSILPLPVYESLVASLPGVELVKADDTLIRLRMSKSPDEITQMRKAYRISEKAIDAILGQIRPGMTELQVIGIAQHEIYRHGGDYEGHALYCFCGAATNNAISRPTHNKIRKNTMIQLNIGARVSGYSSSVGLPFSIGPLPERQRKLLEFGLEAHHKTFELLKPGQPAGEIVRRYEGFVQERGFGKHMLYGPCHGIGMMEVERPWMESTSNYKLRPDMIFQVDTFFNDRTFGLRWENGARITKTGVEKLSRKFMKLIML